MIRFKCSQCGEELEAPDSMAGAGERLQCPKCRFPEPIPELELEPEPIKIEEIEDFDPNASTQIRTFDSKAEDRKKDYQRPLSKTGKGATRVRTFHTRLSDKALIYLDEIVNDWIDENRDIEIKFSSTTVGMVEGKKTEPHIILTVWY